MLALQYVLSEAHGHIAKIVDAEGQACLFAQRKPLRRRVKQQRGVPVDVEALDLLSATISLAS